MSISDYISGRYSVRAYKKMPVERVVLEKVLNLALSSPSWGNTQPWEFAVAGGAKLEEIRNSYVESAKAGVSASPDFPFPDFWPEKNKNHYFENGKKLYKLLDIKREDKAARDNFQLRGTEFFQAPQVIFLFLDQELSPWSLFDLGIFAQSLMLAAYGFGLGTCPMAMAGVYPDLVREAMGIPSSKKLALGIPIGYIDESDKINSYRSTRILLEDAILKWDDLG
ncbi:MAG: nitroreductase [Peptococcaceae bacterium]|nr:nitroreductase [Peptococcaceae bacterium]